MIGLVVFQVLTAAFVAPRAEVMDAIVAAPASADLGFRLEAVTRPFLDAPYVLSPLGEGDGQLPDTDPRLRFDAFDCTTFVETALALALSSSTTEARMRLDLIRYRDTPSFAARRHFPEAEWIPELVAVGLLRDITREVGGDDVTIARKHLDAQVWHRTHHKGLPALEDRRIPDGTFALPVWSLDRAAAHPERIPPGTILHVVRADFANVPVRVSHQGVVLDVGGRRVLRHAADRLHHRVVDEGLDVFLERMKRYGKWPVTGVHLTRVIAEPGWSQRLAAARPVPAASAPP